MSLPLFWDKEYAFLQEGKNNLLSFHTVDENALFIIPHILDEAHFKSPGVGTFGGLYPNGEVKNWDEVWISLMQATPSASDYEIIFPPNYFQTEIFTPQIDSCIKVFNPQITIDMNQYVKLENYLTQLLSTGNRKKVRQFQEKGGTFRRGSSSDLDSIIPLLQVSRERLGVSLSMTRAQIKHAFQEMPNIYSCYAVEIDKSIAAAAITVEISQDVLYVLYWGDDAESWRHLSPVASLFVGIFQEAKNSGYKFLDLGASSVDGVVNTGLRNFKANLGCLDTPRIRVKFQRSMSLV